MERSRDRAFDPDPNPPELAKRVGLAVATALAVVAVALAIPVTGGAGGGVDALEAAAEQRKSDLGIPHDDALLAAHDHSDPATKNDISRGLAVGDGVVDPSTVQGRAAAEAYVATERALPDPKLRTVAAYPPRQAAPQDRYAMAGGCYTLQAPSGAYVTRSGTNLALAPVAASGAAAFYFKATRLGGYLMHTEAGEVTAGGTGKVVIAAKPGPQADWTAQPSGSGYRFELAPGQALTVTGSTLSRAAGAGTTFALRTAATCPAYPEAEINITGDPFAGTTSIQEVRGFVDAHTHGMAFEFLGGDLHCGRPWHQYGVPYALPNCTDNLVAGVGTMAVGAVLSGKPAMDPVGWPTFNDWPAPDALTHEGTYYRWMERAWRGGQRLFVNLLVENNQLCQLYPIKRNSCDDMDSIRLQAADMLKFQDYIDAQFGGPGKGFYRIVKDPFEARKVINDGKMAVVMGIETSIPFGCTFKFALGKDTPACTKAEIDQNLDEMHQLGVRQMELVNKFDNALAGVAGDAGQTGVLVNSANFLETGTFWAMEHCDPADGESADNPQLALPDITAGQQDALFGAIGQVLGLLPAVPLYPTPQHCNRRGLTDLGVHTIEGLAKRQMIFDPDHLSVKARAASMDVIEDLGYPGIISSHSWSTPDTYPRIYRAGGFITPYAGDSTGFVDKWRRHLGWADPRYYFGFGFGADINGLGAQGNPRGAGVTNPVTYPFRGLGGVLVDRQRAGQRVWDINADGVAQYGLYPDWVEDLRQVAEKQRAGDGQRIVDDMARGAEAYLQMWERAYGVAPDSCRNVDLRMSLKKARKLAKRMDRKNMTTRQVLARVGQPYQRLGSKYVFCAKPSKKAIKKAAKKANGLHKVKVKKLKKVRVVVKFRSNGTVKKVRIRR